MIMLLMYRDAWRLVSCAAKNVAIRIASRVSGIAEEQPLLCEKISECLSSKSRRIAALVEPAFRCHARRENLLDIGMKQKETERAYTYIWRHLDDGNEIGHDPLS